ncbi:MAG TPA: hypothetical protein VMH88_03900 [Gemmatimonadales bacterium]|nr:hypothetical protein [Gemmatimonadales bacterium]
MRRLMAGLCLLALACAPDKGTAPTTDLVSAAEKIAVQRALALGFNNDSLYQALSAYVFPFVEQATPQVHSPGDTTKLTAVQLSVTAGSTTEGLSGVIAWRGYHPTTGIVDSVFLVLGSGLVPPISDSLQLLSTFDTPGTGTAWVIAQTTDTSVQVWQSRSGALHVASASYGAGTSASSGYTLTRYRGTLAGDYHLTAKLVPDSSTTVSTDATYPGGIYAVKVAITGL